MSKYLIRLSSVFDRPYTLQCDLSGFVSVAKVQNASASKRLKDNSIDADYAASFKQVHGP